MTGRQLSTTSSAHLRPASARTISARGAGRIFLAFLASVLLLAACGGDDNGIRIVAPVTPTADPTTPTPTPEPTPVPLPERPDEPLNGGTLVAQYLHLGEPDIEGCLPELVEAWEMTEVEGPRCLLADLDGDGRDEYVFLASFPAESDDGDARADLWFFDDEEEERRLYHSATALTGGLIYNARIVDVDDVTSDGVPDVMIAWERCVDDVCTTRFIIASHHNGSLENLAPAGVAVDALDEIEIDAEEQRMILHGRPTADATTETGPLRGTTTEIWWSTSRFRSAQRPSDPQYLVHLLNDADAAFARGDYRDARQIYERAAVDGELRDWQAELGEQPARPELQAYALLRAALSAQRSGDGTAMLELLDRAADAHPETMHGAAAIEYREALEAGQSPAAACQAVESFLGTFAGFYRDFWDYGSANPGRDIVTLCR